MERRQPPAGAPAQDDRAILDGIPDRIRRHRTATIRVLVPDLAARLTTR
jgi:hypothetical protein